MNGKTRPAFPLIVTTGDFANGELFAPTAKLRSCSRHAEFAALLNSTQTGEIPDLVVLLQKRRGEYQQGDVDRLRDRFPDSAFVIVYGPWCEGESRSGSPLKNIRRIPAREWELEFEEFLEDYDMNGCERWRAAESQILESQPVTERPCAELSNEVQALIVSVEARDPDMREALFDLFLLQGWDLYKQTDAPEGSGVDVLVVDCRESVDEVAPVAAKYSPDVPVVALLGFPRQADREALNQMRSGSGAWLVAKPWTHSRLVRAVSLAAKAKKANYSP